MSLIAQQEDAVSSVNGNLARAHGVWRSENCARTGHHIPCLQVDSVPCSLSPVRLELAEPTSRDVFDATLVPKFRCAAGADKCPKSNPKTPGLLGKNGWCESIWWSPIFIPCYCQLLRCSVTFQFRRTQHQHVTSLGVALLAIESSCSMCDQCLWQ
eukprot:11395-Rhodomonas_salina.2